MHEPQLPQGSLVVYDKILDMCDRVKQDPPQREGLERGEIRLREIKSGYNAYVNAAVESERGERV